MVKQSRNPFSLSKVREGARICVALPYCPYPTIVLNTELR
jgi:hypothetical protein